MIIRVDVKAKPIAVAGRFTSVAACLENGKRSREKAIWAALRYISEANTTAATEYSFASNHGISPRSAARYIENLENLGFIQRTDQPMKKPVQHLHITREGRSALNTEIDPDLVDSGLSASEMSAALEFISEANVKAPTAKSFADQHGVSESTAAIHIGHLEQRGFVQRAVNPENRRTKVLYLTPKGKTALASNDPLIPSALRLTSEFLPAQLDTVGKSLDILANRVPEWSHCECRECDQIIGHLEEALLDEAVNFDVKENYSSTTRPTPSKQACAIVRALALLSRCILRGAGSNDLTPSSWAALRYFSLCKPEEATSACFADHHGMTRQNVSLIAVTLKDQGLIVAREGTGKKANPKQFQLTEKAKQLLPSDPTINIATLLEREFTEPDLRTIDAALQTILKTQRSPASVA